MPRNSSFGIHLCGLHVISNSEESSKANAHYPVHFVHVWLAYYFKTHYPVYDELCGPPMVKYLGEGGAKYHDPDQVHRRIFKDVYADWSCTIPTRNSSYMFSDDRKGQRSDHAFFISIRSCFLTLRKGNHFILEPYNPHRFGCQLGFYQVEPGMPRRKDHHRCSLDEGLCLYKLSTLLKTSSKSRFPSVPYHLKKHHSIAYKEWWKNVKGDYLMNNAEKLAASRLDEDPQKGKEPVEEFIKVDDIARVDVPDSSKACDKDSSLMPICEEKNSMPRLNSVIVPCDVQASNDSKRKLSCLEESGSNKQRSNPKSLKPIPIDVDENVSENDHASENNKASNEEEDDAQSQPVAESKGRTFVQDKSMSLSRSKKKQVPPKAAHSTFVADNAAMEHQKHYLQNCWNTISDKISRTSLDSMSSIEGGVRSMYNYMEVFLNIDVSYVRELLKDFFKKAKLYDEARSDFSDKSCDEELAQKLREAEAHLEEFKVKGSNEESWIEGTMKELDTAKSERKALKKKIKRLEASSKDQREVLETTRAKIETADAEVAKLKTTSDEARVNDSKGNLEAASEELKNLKPF